MATTKLWSVTGNIKRVIEYVANTKKTTYNKNQDLENELHYIENDFKTEEKKLVSCINCSPETALEDMIRTKKKFMKEDKVVALHAYQSFNAGEVTPEEANRIGLELAKEMWGDKFEIVVATHINTGHIHNHIVVNSVSFVDGSKAKNNHAELSKLRHISDEICYENGLDVLKESEYYNNVYKSDVLQSNYESKAKYDIDECIKISKTYKEFLQNLKSRGYFVEQRTRDSLSICDSNHKRNIRIARSFGKDYTIDKIQERIYYKIENDNRLTKVNKKYYKRVFIGQKIDKKLLRMSPLYRRYIHYKFAIGQYPREFYFKEITPQMLKDKNDFKALCKQIDFISKHKIQSYKEICEKFIDRNEELTTLRAKKNALVTKLKRTNDENKKEEILKEKQDTLNQIENLQKEVVMYKKIIYRHERLKEEMKQRTIGIREERIKDEIELDQQKKNENYNKNIR